MDGAFELSSGAKKALSSLTVDKLQYLCESTGIAVIIHNGEITHTVEN